MSRTYFGTDGIRGTVGQDPITPDFMLRLGHAVGRVLRQATPRPTVLIGKDTRISGYMLESSLEAGFASAGVDVLLSGPLPTPGVAYLTRALRLDLGVVISASHNPFADNGVKFFSARGEKLPDDWEHAVEAMLLQPPQWVDSAGLGKARRLEDARGRYIEFCKSTVPHSLSLRGMKLVVDAAHGAASGLAEELLDRLGALALGLVEGGHRHEGVGLLRLELGHPLELGLGRGEVPLLAVDVSEVEVDDGLVRDPGEDLLEGRLGRVPLAGLDRLDGLRVGRAELGRLFGGGGGGSRRAPRGRPAGRGRPLPPGPVARLRLRRAPPAPRPGWPTAGRRT